MIDSIVTVLSYGQLFLMCCMNLTQTVSSMSPVSWKFFFTFNVISTRLHAVLHLAMYHVMGNGMN